MNLKIDLELIGTLGSIWAISQLASLDTVQAEGERRAIEFGKLLAFGFRAITDPEGVQRDLERLSCRVDGEILRR